MSLVDYRSTKRGELSVAALPGTHVRVQWIHENGAIEYERVYYRPEVYQPVETGDLAQLNRSASMHELTTANLLTIRERVEDLKSDVVRLQKENTELRAKMKPDAAYF